MIEKVMGALAEWLIRVASKDKATPEEIAALVVVARIVADYHYSLVADDNEDL